MSRRRLYWAVMGFGLFALTAYGASRRFHTLFDDAPVKSHVLLITLLVIALVCAVACYVVAVGRDQPRRPRR